MRKVLVVTLYCGENEFSDCCQSVQEQIGVEVDHYIIENLPKKKAHEKLFKVFNDNNDKYDFFAKLDADMAFSNKLALKCIVDRFDDGVDVVSSTVYDGITGTDMQSFNVFSNRCYFNWRTNDPLFTDRVKIDYAGRHVSFVDAERNVLHAFNPTPFQAFMFGVHRALKVVQPGRQVPAINNAYHQRRILNDAYRNFLKTGSLHSRHALWGASLVFKGEISTPALIRKEDYSSAFLEVQRTNGVQIDKRLMQRGVLSLHKIMGKKRFFRGFLSFFFKLLRRR